MGSPSLPAQPAAPDYASANREGIITDISTLPLRNQINQGAQLGTLVNYIDPKTGQPATADFRGGFDDAAFLKAHPEFAEPYKNNGSSSSWLQDAIKASDYLDAKAVDGQFRQTGGNAALAGSATQSLIDSNASLAAAQLALRQKLGIANVQQTAAEIRAADPGAAALRDQLTAKLGTALDGPASNVAASANLAAGENRLWNIANAAPKNDSKLNELYSQFAKDYDTRVDDVGTKEKLAALEGTAQSRLGTRGEDTVNRGRLGNIYDDATRLPTDFMDASQLALMPALRGAMQDYALGGKLNASETRAATDSVRSGQAARGNYLGDAAAVQEAIALADRGDAKQQQRLQNLLTIQGQTFGQNDTLRDDSQAAKLARLGNLTGLQGQSFGQEQSLREEDRNSAQQQISTLSTLAQQLFGNAQGLRKEGRDAVAQKAGVMQSIAGQNFQQDQGAYTTGLNAAQAAMNGTQSMVNNQLQTDQINYGRDQQKLANASAMVLGMPVTNQFGSLGGAQNGAVGFTAVNSPNAGQLNPNAGAAGASFASSNFGTNANMWNTSANLASQGNPWQSLLGNVVGQGAGAAMQYI